MFQNSGVHCSLRCADANIEESNGRILFLTDKVEKAADSKRDNGKYDIYIISRIYIYINNFYIDKHRMLITTAILTS